MSLKAILKTGLVLEGAALHRQILIIPRGNRGHDCMVLKKLILPMCKHTLSWSMCTLVREWMVCTNIINEIFKL